MIASPTSGLTVAGLERILSRTEAAVLLVPPRILRRVIKRDRRLTGPGLQVPHRKSYFINRDVLFRIAEPTELGLGAGRILPAALLLLPVPDPARLAARPRAETLLQYWRLLFHARVHLAIAERRAGGRLDDTAVHDRIAAIGPTEFDEIRAVLRQEHFLLPPGDAATVYEEFAAVYLELRAFAGDRLAAYFPDVTDFSVVDRVLAADVDAAALFAATRLEGAPDPVIAAPLAEGEDPEIPPPEPPTTAAIVATPAPVTIPALAAKADRAAALGNRVAAAILRRRAALAAPPRERRVALGAARGEIEALLTRLRTALQLPDDEVDGWRAALVALLEPASAGLWPIEARFLYDMQKVCVDNERAIYALDLVEWIVSWGHRPVKRLLPNQPLILTVKHLHKALHRLTGVRIAEPLRIELVHLMTAAVHRSERQLRARFHPLIHQALDRVGFKADNYAERVSRDKLIEELLDRVVARRFLGMGDLRDAIARNQLKLPDLAGPREFFLGDKLICANRQFADDLDGVYRRGEVYLRWLQRLSALAFGTSIGRFLTRYLVLPFGGAYLTLEAIHHLLELFGHEPTIDAEAAPAAEVFPAHELHLVNPYSVAALGLFLFALLYVGWFRRGAKEACVLAWNAVRTVTYEWPASVLRLPWVERLLQSRPYLILYQFFLKPIPWAAGAALATGLLGVGPAVALAIGTAAFAIACVLHNSRLGLHLEEICTDEAVRTWQLLRRDLVPGLYRLVVFLFKRLLEDVERVLYAVDEFLRFRAGDPRAALVWKPALGLIWFGATYVIRLAINLFVEPTFNPIKHFPVVTVTAKLIVPVIKPLTLLVMVPLEPMVGRHLALALAGIGVFFLPGLAGFLVWELKENWKLYRANRPADLQPVVVGSHGETLARFMRPGFHSGTLPKLYARLRRRTGTAAHKQYEALHHVRDSLRHFVERDLVAILACSKRWDAPAPTVGEVHLGTNRMRFELGCAALGGDNVYVDLEEHAGRLVAGMTLPQGDFSASWLARLHRPQETALQDALAGFYKIAGVDEVREHKPRERSFAEMPLRWGEWVQIWELDQAGKQPTTLRPSLLPALAQDAGSPAVNPPA